MPTLVKGEEEQQLYKLDPYFGFVPAEKSEEEDMPEEEARKRLWLAGLGDETLGTFLTLPGDARAVASGRAELLAAMEPATAGNGGAG